RDISFLLCPPAPPEISTLSLHDALPISQCPGDFTPVFPCMQAFTSTGGTLAGNVGVPQPSYMQGAYCQLIPGNKYYLNIRQVVRSEEHTSELQSRSDLVCRLLLEKKKKK